MQVSDDVYALFSDDRAAHEALAAANAKLDHRLLGLGHESEFYGYYEEPAETPRPKQPYRDYRVVYRSGRDVVKDPNQGKTTELWPLPKNWRKACSARRRWEL